MTEDSESDNTNRIIKRWIFFVVWFVILLFYFSSFSSANLFALFYSVLLIVPIRFFGDKKVKTSDIKTDIKSMFIRIWNCRPKYKIRTIVSWVLFFFFFILSLVSIIGNIKENRIETAKQEAYNNAPSPIIEILSQSWNLWNVTWYTLVYKTKDATNVIIGSQTFSGNDKENSVNFSLDWVWKNSLNILVLARNEYKSTEKNISVTRDKTVAEIKIENDEKARIAKEQKQETIRIANEKKQEEAKKLQEESSNRQQYATLMRERYLDAWLDIKVSVKWKYNTTLALTYVLMGDVTVHQLRETQELEWGGMGFTRVDFYDGYWYHAWLNY